MIFGTIGKNNIVHCRVILGTGACAESHWTLVQTWTFWLWAFWLGATSDYTGSPSDLVGGPDHLWPMMALRNKVHERKIFDTPYFLSNHVNYLDSSYFGAKSLQKGKYSWTWIQAAKVFPPKIFQLSPDQELRLTSALIISFYAYFRNPMFKLLYLMKNYICCILKHLFLKLFWSSWLTLQGFL